MPECLAATRIEASFLGRRNKPRDSFLVGGSKEKRLVKFTAACKLRVSWFNPGVFRDLARTHMVEAGDADATFLGDFVQNLTDFLVRASKCQAKVASRPCDVRNLDIEISIRKIDSATAFRNEGMAVLELAAQRLDFVACAGGHQHQRNVAARKLRQRFLGLSEGTCAGVQQSAFEAGVNDVTRGEQGREECNSVERSAVLPFLKLSVFKTQFQDTVSKHKRRTGASSRSAVVIAPRLDAWHRRHQLIARCGLSASGLRNADVAGYFILTNLVDDHFQGPAIVALMEEYWFVYRQVLLVDVNVVDDQRNAVALLVEVRALEFDHERANLLWLVLGVDRELEVVPLTEPPKLFHIFMIARDQGSQFAARHFQIVLCGVKIRADSRYFAVHGLNVIVGRLGG